MRSLLIWAVAAVCLPACKPAEDDQASNPPTVAIITPTQAVLAAEPEQVFQVIVEYTDDAALARVGGRVTPATWAYTYERAAAGTQTRDTFLLAVPSGVASGPYLLVLYAEDADGQRTEATLTFNVQNTSDTEDPFISLQSPSEGQMFTNGDYIPVMGSVTDNRGLATVYAVLRKNSNVLDEKLVTVGADVTAYTLNDSLFVPDTLSIGTYEVRVTALDTAGNTVFLARSVVVN